LFGELVVNDLFYCYFESADGITVWLANTKISARQAISEYGTHDFDSSASVVVNPSCRRSQ
jgi:hypothetical protein